MEEIRILHTSDVHLGAPFLFLETRGGQQRIALREALERLVKTAREERFHLLVVAGDLFDAAVEVSDADVSFAIRCLSGAGPLCRVVILPGGHDCYAAGSVYERERGRFEESGNVHILAPGRRVIEFPDLSLAVHGVALTASVPRESGFAGLVPLERCRWNVCLAHGSMEGFSSALESGEEPLRAGDLDPGFDYAALGHWHSHLVVRASRPVIVYSGSPEVVARDQYEAGSGVAVTLAGGEARFERVPAGKRRIARRTVECTGLRTTEDLVRAVLAAEPPDGNSILELSLSGLIGIDAALDAEEALAALRESYFSARISGKEPSRAIAKDELLAVPEETVAGRFVRAMLRRIEGSEGEARALYEEALQLGYQLFKGRNLLG